LGLNMPGLQILASLPPCHCQPVDESSRQQVTNIGLQQLTATSTTPFERELG